MRTIIAGTMVCLLFAAVSPERAADADAEQAAIRIKELESQNLALWRRLAVVSIRKYLDQPGREQLDADLGKRLEQPQDYLTVSTGRDNELYVGHLRDHAALSKTPFPKVDPAAVVVIYLNGPVGGGARIGVVFDKSDGKELAIVAVPGK